MILKFPDIIPDANTFTLVPNNTTFESPFTRSMQVLSFGPARWEARLSFSHLNYEQAQQLETFILSLSGVVNHFYLYDHARDQSKYRLGDPVALRVSNNLIETSGWFGNQKILRVGDYFSVNNELKRVTQDAHSDENGRASVQFAPNFREKFRAQTLLEYHKPSVLMRLRDDNQGASQRSAGQFTRLDINCVEVL